MEPPWWVRSDRRMARRHRLRQLSRGVDVALDATILVLLTAVVVIAGAAMVLAGPLVPASDATCPVPGVPAAGCACQDAVRS